MEEKIRLGLVGCGHLNRIVASAQRKGLLPQYTLVGAYSRTFGHARELTGDFGGEACETLEALLAQKPDYIVEAASPACLRAIAAPVLKSGVNLIVLSIGAFADPEFYASASALAREHGCRVHIASGAVGGFDVLRTAALMSEIQAGITTHKGPASLRNTPLFQEALMEAEEESEVFHGSAEEAIALLPTKVNVAVAASLATAGPQKTNVSIHSVPDMTGDDHRIEVVGDEVHALVDIYSKTSDIAGWSVVALLQNLVSPIVF